MLEGAKLELAMMAIALFVSVLSSAASAEEMPGGKEAMFKIKMTYADVVVTATLYDNATTRWLRNKLPLTIPMMNRYGRELVYRFPEALPTDNVSVRSYEVGEIVSIEGVEGSWYTILGSREEDKVVIDLQTIGRKALLFEPDKGATITKTYA